jgi:hypothetical protein
MIRYPAAMAVLLALSACQTAGVQYKRDDSDTRAVSQGQTIRLNRFYQLELDCRSVGLPEIKLVSASAGGRIVGQAMTGFPFFKADNPRAKCNSRRSPARGVFYTPAPGFTGVERVVFEVFWVDGDVWRETYTVTVR